MPAVNLDTDGDNGVALGFYLALYSVIHDLIGYTGSQLWNPL